MPSPAPAHRDTHTAAADEDNEKRLQHTSCAHHPGQPQEEDDPEDVLQAGQVHAHEGAHAGCLRGQEGRGTRHQRGPGLPQEGGPRPSAASLHGVQWSWAISPTGSQLRLRKHGA